MCKDGDQVVVQIPNNIEILYNDPTERRVRKDVSIDRCLVDEIKSLWRNGICTQGCCCGHYGESPAFINIHLDDIYKALDLGYKLYKYPNDSNRKDTVIPHYHGIN